MLIQCRDCKQEYDDAHGACPYCSAPMSEEDRPAADHGHGAQVNDGSSSHGPEPKVGPCPA